MGISFASHKRACASAGMAVLLAAALAVPASAAFADPTAAEKQAEAEAKLTELNNMQEQLDKASNDYYQALDEQQAAEKRVDQAKEKVEQKSKEIASYQGKLGDRARSMYRSGDTSFIDVILGSSSFEEFATTWNTLEKLNENDANLVSQTKAARVELEAAEQEAEQQAEVAAQKSEEAKQVKDQAEATTAELQTAYDTLSAEAQELLRKEEEAAEQARQAAAAAAAAAASSSGSSSSVNNSAVQSVTGNTVVDRAYAQLGKPYVWGAAGPNAFDCSGLVGYCITGVMGNHWCTTYTMENWTRVTDPQPGDFALNSHHTGVYIGNGQMIHAPHTGDVVKVSAVHSGMWYVRYTG